MLTLLVSLVMCNPPRCETLNESLLRTFRAVCWVESRGDPRCPPGDGGLGIGIAQIHPIYVRDCNRILGWEEFTLADRWSVARSWQMFRVYTLHWAKIRRLPLTPETFARLHNGGCNLYNSAAATTYWLKVQEAMTHVRVNR